MTAAHAPATCENVSEKAGESASSPEAFDCHRWAQIALANREAAARSRS
jgi:hypothetical protein